jgi:ABC-2 type transport system ATP-binding protein
VYGFLGPNGAGKTTTMRLLVGLLRPDAGRIDLLGAPFSWRDRKRLFRVGSLIETPAFYPYLSGRDNLRVIGATGPPVADARIDEVLGFVALTDRARDRYDTYSLGMKQRLGIAAALLNTPELLLLDEPANGLDPEGIRWLRDLLRSLSAKGRTILISSHVLAEIAQTVDDVAIIQNGRLRAHAPLAELTTQAAGGVRVKTPTAERLRDLLAGAGVGAKLVAPDHLAVEGTPERVGEIAAANGVVLHELRADASLEEVFLELTGGGEETSA